MDRATVSYTGDGGSTPSEDTIHFASVAQSVEHRIEIPGAEVRFLSEAPYMAGLTSVECRRLENGRYEIRPGSSNLSPAAIIFACVAQRSEHNPDKIGVSGSIPLVGTKAATRHS